MIKEKWKKIANIFYYKRILYGNQKQNNLVLTAAENETHESIQFLSLGYETRVLYYRGNINY